MARMLGRWRTGGCGCLIPGPDCAGHRRDTRWRKRVEQRAVRREIQAEAGGPRHSGNTTYRQVNRRAADVA